MVNNMRRVMLIAILGLLTVGCSKRPSETRPALFLSNNDLGPTPTFNISIPEGYRLEVYHGNLLYGSTVQLKEFDGAKVQAFIKDAGFWFALGTNQSQRFWFSYDPMTGVVTYQNLDKPGHEYCIYVLIPNDGGLL